MRLLGLILLLQTSRITFHTFKNRKISLFVTLYFRKCTLFQSWCFMYQNIIIITSWCSADLSISKLNESQSPHFLLTAQLKVKVHGRKRCLEVLFLCQRGWALLNKPQYFWNKTRPKWRRVTITLSRWLDKPHAVYQHKRLTPTCWFQSQSTCTTILCVVESNVRLTLAGDPTHRVRPEPGWGAVVFFIISSHVKP